MQMLAALMSFKIPSRNHLLHAAALACGPWRAPLRHGHGHGHDFQMMPGTDGRWPPGRRGRGNHTPRRASLAGPSGPAASRPMSALGLRPAATSPGVAFPRARSASPWGTTMEGLVSGWLVAKHDGFGDPVAPGRRRVFVRWHRPRRSRAFMVSPLARERCARPCWMPPPASCVRLARGLPNDAPGWAGVGAACHPQALWPFMGG